jgi:HlyD family secretion protein
VADDHKRIHRHGDQLCGLKSRLLMLEREGANRERGPDRVGRAEVRAVSLLRRSGRLAAVSSGLAVGDRVIVYPSDRIASGARVASR